MGALAADGQATAVADALVAADLDLALDVLGDVAAQVTFDLEVGVDVGAELGDLFLGEVAAPGCSGSMPVAVQTWVAVVRPMPKM